MVNTSSVSLSLERSGTIINKDPWEQYPKIWPTKASFMNYIRGGIRRGLWEKSPIKLQFIKDNRVRVPLGKKTDKNPKGLVWGCVCSLCKEQFKQIECQVDHLQGNHSLKSMDDLLNFVKAMLFINEEDLALVCKPCHKIKTYSERMGITFDEAKAEKEAIIIIKKKEDKTWLEAKGIEPASNQAARREQLVTRLLEEYKK